MTFDDASRAVYVDFETTGTDIARPALIGLLGPDQEFLQHIVDPELHDAVRAHPATRASELTITLSDIAAGLERRDAVWCAWSTFDLGVIEATAPAAPAAILKRRFRNGLDTVPRWAATHGIRPPRGRFEPRNQLHRFFEVAGYRPDRRYASAAPVRWIRHVRSRMKVAGGQYRKVTRSTTRHWHQLLQYNRHDCVGLRHVVLRATAERTSVEHTWQPCTRCVRAIGS